MDESGQHCFQDTNLFKMSIADNVAFYTPGASRDNILRALHLAQCDDILEKLPDGADTVIGTKGVYLSGGEMQRISLARAILKDAPVVLLDEATAFADAENEHLIQKGTGRIVAWKDCFDDCTSFVHSSSCRSDLCFGAWNNCRKRNS